MIELVFTVCLLTSPEKCEERAIQYVDVTPTSCMMNASPYLARWVGQHPGWKVTRWKCESPSARKIDA